MVLDNSIIEIKKIKPNNSMEKLEVKIEGMYCGAYLW